MGVLSAAGKRRKPPEIPSSGAATGSSGHPRETTNSALSPSAQRRLNLFHRWAVKLEWRLIRGTFCLCRIPLLRLLHRDLTATLRMLNPDSDNRIGFSLDLSTPYFHLPVEMDQSQIGHLDDGHQFQPAAFRFFDWHSWRHIEGEIRWHGQREVVVQGEQVTLVQGFEYRIETPAANIGHLGLRLVEGVEGRVRVLVGEELMAMKFEPVYWMLEPRQGRYQVVPILDDALMVLIVSLSELGSEQPGIYRCAVEHLWKWVLYRYGAKCPERHLLEFLRYVRQWAPLGLEPLFQGLKEVLDRLQLADKERILFEFYADNWGVGNNPRGRLLAVRLLEAMGTGKAYVALLTIHTHVENQGLPAEELALIRRSLTKVEARLPGADQNNSPEFLA